MEPIHASQPPAEKTVDSSNEQTLEYTSCAKQATPRVGEDLSIEEEPEFHRRTYLAVLALFFLNFVQVFALTGPPAILPYMAAALHGESHSIWIPNALSLVQAVIGPLIAFGSDTFQARKFILVGLCCLSFIGAAVAPNVNDIYGLIGATILIGFGFAAVPLAYAIPSEILPRRWRPLAQSLNNIAAALASTSSPLIAGAFVRRSRTDGYQNFYWVMMAIWGLTVLAILFGYKPPKRHTRLDDLTIWQKIGRLDLPGSFLLTAGLTMLLVGISLGNNPYPWTNSHPLSLIIVGGLVLVSFGIFEWRFTKIGIFHHDLFEGHGARVLGISIVLIAVEGLMLNTIIVFYPAITKALYEDDAFLVSARGVPYQICSIISTVVFGFYSSKYRSIRAPMMVGFAIFTGGIVGLSTLQPGESTKAICFDGLAGLGFGAPLILIISAVQLGTPHHLIATATALATSSRALTGAVFNAIYSAAVTSRMESKLPSYIANAAVRAGLPAASVPTFVAAIANQDTTALPSIAGVTPAIIDAGVAAAQHASADSMRVVYIIAAPFGACAILVTWFLGDLSKTMHYKVDAPMEELHSKRHQAQREGV